jgi:C4-dicarboxylate-specific signal transduction histidine kinase
MGFDATLSATGFLQVAEPAVLPAPLLLSALAAAALLLGIWWIRERRLNIQRRSMRAFHALSEDIISAASPAEIAEKLVRVLPTISEATAVRLYLFNRRVNSLERVPTAEEPEPMAVSLESPQEGLPGAAAVCFRNRAILNVPDVRRSPFAKGAFKAGMARSAMFVPLFAQPDVVGVLELGNEHKPGYFSPEEQAAAQHLANQVAASLKLQQQQSIREQLFRTEKLAATGQLISGVASELRAPLESILQLASSLAAYQGRAVPEGDLRLLAGESKRASEIVSRLVSFARPEDAEARVVDVNALVGGLMEFRGREWKALGLRVQNRLSVEPATVLGAQAQLEQVFLNLLVHAEQRAAEAAPRTLTVSNSTIAGRVLIEIAYSSTMTEEREQAELDPFAGREASKDGALGLGVCQGIIQSHGGEIRFRTQSGTARFEVDLPVTRMAGENAAASEAHQPVRPLTMMLVDSTAQRQLMGMLGARGHRVVPVRPDEAVDLAQRLRFDAALWGNRPGGPNWSDFRERLRAHIPAFVLVSEGYDPELARSLEESGGMLLARPIQEFELDRVLKAIETRSPNSPVAG